MNVVRYPETYLKAYSKGHLMGTHTWSHKFLPSLTNEQLVAQFEWSIWAMNATAHHIPKWYRPPYGAIDDRVRAVARAFGMQAVLWDHDLVDWGMEASPPIRTKQRILDDARRFKAEGKGGLSLEHDAYASTVDAAIEVSKIFGADQLTVAQCVDSIDYIRRY
ncbi:DEKNAAC100328 [Brettanomyces naardenensis]|uniref:chitin deacetylase n=1 Tax=Brettanomyces naardenensis TaxID=13370 RepID=A0A448YFA2_BRENA|nr:DEKNAAC100328 [Brettanomyces naardenensis]